METTATKVMSIFMWPDGGMSSKVIDLGLEKDRRKFAKMAAGCNAVNGVVITMGVNKHVPDNGWRALRKEMGKRGFVQQTAEKIPAQPPKSKASWARKLCFWK